MTSTKERTTAAPSVLARCVAAEIRSEMGARRMSGQALARAINKSQNYVSTRLRDRRDFTLDDVDAIASYFKLDPSVLIARGYADHGERALLALTEDETGGLVVVEGEEAINLFEAKAREGSRRRPPPHGRD